MFIYLFFVVIIGDRREFIVYLRGLIEVFLKGLWLLVYLGIEVGAVILLRVYGFLFF